MTPVEERIDHEEAKDIAEIMVALKSLHEEHDPASLKVARAYLALLTEHSAAQARLDGEGPQVSMGTAAGILGREVEARKDAEQRVNVLRKCLGEEQADRILSAATKENPCQ